MLNYRDSKSCINCQYSISDFDSGLYCDEDNSAISDNWMKDKQWLQEHRVCSSGVCDKFKCCRRWYEKNKEEA